MDEVRRLAQGVYDRLDVLVFQQAAAFSPQLRQLGLNVHQLGGADGGVQQALALEGGNLVALLRGGGDGLVDF